MADYNGTFRSSYFQVENEETYESLKHHLVATDGVEFWDQEKGGAIYHAFGGYGSIIGYAEDAKSYEEGESDEEPDFDRFMNGLSKIIKEGDACVIMSAGHEKLRYVGGGVTVITKNRVEFDSLVNRSEEILKDHGVNPNSVYMNIIKAK